MEKFEPAQSGRNLMDRLFSLTNNSHLFFCLLFSFQRPIRGLCAAGSSSAAPSRDAAYTERHVLGQLGSRFFLESLEMEN
jgi:hypothetical protein